MMIKEHIEHYLLAHEVVKETSLVNYLLSQYESKKKDEIKEEISSLVEHNQIIRLEFIPPNSSFRSVIYFPLGTQIK